MRLNGIIAAPATINAVPSRYRLTRSARKRSSDSRIARTFQGLSRVGPMIVASAKAITYKP